MKRTEKPKNKGTKRIVSGKRVVGEKKEKEGTQSAMLKLKCEYACNKELESNHQENSAKRKDGEMPIGFVGCQRK